MVLKRIRFTLIISLFAFLIAAMLPTGDVHALTDPINRFDLPALDTFIEQVRNGQVDQVRGIYIPGILAAPVVQQPTGMDDFVSPRQNIVTQFKLASKLGSTGLLAHNYLAGERFAILQEGQEFHLIKGDGHVSTFIVSEILQYQALDPDSTASAFADMENGGVLTYSELFTKIYNRPGQVVFQTCVYTDGDPSAGRLFIIAEPYLP